MLRYFELAPEPDRDAFVDLFAEDAVVTDEGRTHVGREAIRAWRSDVPLVDYEITAAEPDGDGVVVPCTISGDFPGSPVPGLRFESADFDEDHVKALPIG